jgi:hypothetical protein
MSLAIERHLRRVVEVAAAIHFLERQSDRVLG